jgi:hypothetical protein
MPVVKTGDVNGIPEAWKFEFANGAVDVVAKRRLLFRCQVGNMKLAGRRFVVVINCQEGGLDLGGTFVGNKDASKDANFTRKCLVVICITFGTGFIAGKYQII